MININIKLFNLNIKPVLLNNNNNKTNMKKKQKTKIDICLSETYLNLNQDAFNHNKI